MLKHFFIAVVILFLLAGGIGAYASKKSQQRRQELAQKKLQEKAPEITITIIEGWTVDMVAQYLEKQGIVKAEDFLKYQSEFTDASYAFLKDRPPYADLEGFLFPDTYRIPAFTMDQGDPKAASEAIIRKMLDNFENKLARLANRNPSLTPYQKLILASIIEKETGRNAVTAEQRTALDAERKIVAGIFMNRLNQNHALESDATVNYITKKKTPGVSAADLEINSPYNTYMYPGLPPGPIASPSFSSLAGAYDPGSTDYFYFLHKQPSGEPVYSTTFEEHIRNKNLYLK